MGSLNYRSVLAPSQEAGCLRSREQWEFSPVPMSLQGVCVLISCSHKDTSQM